MQIFCELHALVVSVSDVATTVSQIPRFSCHNVSADRLPSRVHQSETANVAVTCGGPEFLLYTTDDDTYDVKEASLWSLKTSSVAA